MDDNPKPIGASAQQVIASLSASGGLTSPSKPTDPIVAVERAKILAGCYRKDDAADPETYLMALSAVLAEYPPDIVAQVTDPRSGLPSRLNWLPTVKEVKDACEEIDQRRRRFAETARREQEQLEQRRKDEAAKAAKPMLADLQARYGPNYGLSEPPDADARMHARRSAAIADAGRRAFEAECKAAGMDPHGVASPSLAPCRQHGARRDGCDDTVTRP